MMVWRLMTVLTQTADGVDSAGEVAAQNPVAALGGLIAAGLLIIIITVAQIVLRFRQSKTDAPPDKD